MAEHLRQTPNLSQQFGNATARDGSQLVQAIVERGDVYMVSPGTPSASQSLDIATGASHDTGKQEDLSLCLENTRVDVLSNIQAWVDGNDKRRLHWLKGMAGTGKTTIALTVARRCASQRPVASFFFSRGGGDRASAKKFVVTIAAQLSYTVPGFQKHLDRALATNNVVGTGIRSQWKTLIAEPLKKLNKDEFTGPILIIVDALDECDNDQDVAVLIRCFEEVTAITQLRVFVTSRPESPVNRQFTTSQRDMRQDLVLHDIEDSIVEEDIRLFYQDRLRTIAKDFHLDGSLYSDHTVEILVKSSHCLFIYAATVCRFVEDGKQFAPLKLSHILKTENFSLKPDEALNNMYTTILTHSWPIATHLETEQKAVFSRVVGSIVVLRDVLSTDDLALVLDMSVDQIRQMLQSFHSVLCIPEDTSKPIRLLHPSFRDFLLHSDWCQSKVFFIESKEVHGRLFSDCLRLMRTHLMRNMCNLDNFYLRALCVSRADKDRCITSSVRYACRHWAYHLEQHGLDFSAETCRELNEFFGTSFLFWLETLSLLGEFPEAVTAINLLATRLRPPKPASTSTSRSWFSWMTSREADGEEEVSHTSSLQETVLDAELYLMCGGEVIEIAPLVMYCMSDMPKPRKSIIRRLYLSQFQAE